MLTCDWCTGPIESDENTADLRIRFSKSAKRGDVKSWMTMHEECAIRALTAAEEAIEDMPIKERPDASDPDVLEFAPVWSNIWAQENADGPVSNRMDICRHVRSATTQVALHRAGIRTLLDASFRTREQFAAIHGVGATTLKMFDAALPQHGLSFARETVSCRPE